MITILPPVTICPECRLPMHTTTAGYYFLNCREEYPATTFYRDGNTVRPISEHLQSPPLVGMNQPQVQGHSPYGKTRHPVIEAPHCDTGPKPEAVAIRLEDSASTFRRLPSNTPKMVDATGKQITKPLMKSALRDVG